MPVAGAKAPAYNVQTAVEERARADRGPCQRSIQATTGSWSLDAQTSARILTRLLDEEPLNRMHQRATRTRCGSRLTVELPFAVLKHRIFGHPRLLLRGT